MYHTLLTTIRNETQTNNHTTSIIEVKLDKCHLLPQSKRPTKRNRYKQEVKPFDLDKHMKNYSKSEDELSTENNDDIPQLLLITINRYTDDNAPDVINKQPIKFGDTITVPTTTKDKTMQYILVGYVLFYGDTTSGHYRVICRGNDDDDPSWFLYNDENTKELNPRERDNDCYKSEVLFLLYAEEKYYYDKSEGNVDGAI